MNAVTAILPPLDLVADVPTPALVVDVALARENHRRAVASLAPGQRLRPHFKAHKCPALARLQLTDGVTTMCCQTSWEAVTLSRHGVGDIMVTNQIVDPTALDELAEAAGSAEVSVLVDSPAHIALLEATARRVGVSFGVLVEIEVGMERCGVPVESDALIALASAAAASDVLDFAGVQSYDGQNTAIADPVARRSAAGSAHALTQRALERLRAQGIAVPIVAGCATAHLPFLADMGIWTDIQAGSYLLMDEAYGALPDLHYARALFCLASVIHRSPERIVLDVGLKHLSVDRGHPVWAGDVSAPLRLSDEHTAIAISRDDPIAVGDRTFLLPRHIDPTINLYPTLWFLDGGRIARETVDGRMPPRPAG